MINIIISKTIKKMFFIISNINWHRRLLIILVSIITITSFYNCSNSITILICYSLGLVTWNLDVIDLQIQLKPNINELKEKVLIYFHYVYSWALYVYNLKKIFNHILLKLAIFFIFRLSFLSNISLRLSPKLASKVNRSILISMKLVK